MNTAEKTMKIFFRLKEEKSKVVYLANIFGLSESSIYNYIDSIKKAGAEVQRMNGQYWIE
ncbi:MAG: HTH domain-containing protein [Hyphomicrobiales bacterium]